MKQDVKVGTSINRSNQIGPPRFSIAIHSLVWLARSGKLLTSSKMASQVSSHPTFLRKVLSQLAGAGIVGTKEGRDGGYSLKIPAERLTLGDVYEAVRPECLICSDNVPECEGIIKQMDNALEEIVNEAELELIKKLKQYTLEQFMQKIDFTHNTEECFK